jgi:hypothetical protein
MNNIKEWIMNNSQKLHKQILEIFKMSQVRKAIIYINKAIIIYWIDIKYKQMDRVYLQGHSLPFFHQIIDKIK